MCILNTSGHIERCYGGHFGSDHGHLNHPGQLVLDRYNNIVVADSGNNRALLLSPSLICLGYIQASGDPHALHRDQRLYVLDTYCRGVSVLGIDNTAQDVNS